MKRYLKKMTICTTLILLFGVAIMLSAMNAEAATTKKVNTLVISSRSDKSHPSRGVAKDMVKVFERNTYPGYENHVYKYFYNANKPAASVNTSESEASKKGSSYAYLKKMLDKAYSDSSSADVNVLYYTGHTVEIEDLMLDGITQKALPLSSTIGEKNIKIKEFVQLLAKYKGNFIVISDTCYSQAFYTQGVAKLTTGKNRFTCMLVNLDIWETFGCGYTQNLLEGIGYSNTYKSTPADKDKDGFITPREAHEYAGKNAKDPIIRIENAYVELYPGKLADFPLFHHADLKNDTSTVTLYYSGKNETQTLKKMFAANRSPKNINHIFETIISDTKVVKVNSLSKTNKASKWDIQLTLKKSGTARIEFYLAKEMKTKNRTTGKTSTYKQICEGSHPFTLLITVQKRKLELDQKKMTLRIGEKKELKSTVEGESKKVTWSSSDKSIASVSKDGVIKAKMTGTVTITATANGISKSCEVKIPIFQYGSGTKKDPYQVRTWEEFNHIADEEYTGCWFVQTQNITVSETGREQKRFQGHYNGKGYSILCNHRHHVWTDYRDTDKVWGFLIQENAENSVIENLTIQDYYAYGFSSATVHCNISLLVYTNAGIIQNCTVVNGSGGNYNCFIDAICKENLETGIVKNCKASGCRGINLIGVNRGIVQSCMITNCNTCLAYSNLQGRLEDCKVENCSFSSDYEPLTAITNYNDALIKGCEVNNSTIRLTNKKKTRCAGICVRNTGTIESCTLRGTKVLIGLGGNWGETEGSQIAVENTGVIKDTVFLE